jgi:hypothetical protein
LAEWAAVLDVHFNAAPNEGEEGLALRGFYVNRKEGTLKASINLGQYSPSSVSGVIHLLA